MVQLICDMCGKPILGFGHVEVSQFDGHGERYAANHYHMNCAMELFHGSFPESRQKSKQRELENYGLD